MSLSLHAPDAEVDRRGEKRNLAVRLGSAPCLFPYLTLAFRLRSHFVFMLGRAFFQLLILM